MNGVYRAGARKTGRVWRLLGAASIVVLIVLLAVALQKRLGTTPVQRAVNNLEFDSTVSESEKTSIKNAITAQSKTYSGIVKVSAQTTTTATDQSKIISAYVPVTNFNSPRQVINDDNIDTFNLSAKMDESLRKSSAELLKLSEDKFPSATSTDKLKNNDVVFIPAEDLNTNIKLLRFIDSYYLDKFTEGGIFRTITFTGSGAGGLKDLQLNPNATAKKTLKVNMTGVTALTRLMIKKLNAVGDATYFSKKIGKFVADADITHVSNEVSFKPGCNTVGGMSFCAPPKMIDTLKDSGVDLVELTGNHNNDTGNQYNTDTIKTYQELGWGTFGGGLNTTEAAKPFITDQKKSKVAFLGYNYPDAVGGGAVATATTAGANHYDYQKVKADIAAAKKTSNFVIVDIQFWECYSYPEGYVEFPECDAPISGQQATFREVIDAGADMVIGTQAHQPQTYELYKSKPIYYGIGNLYFDQDRWPGTERGIILTHYFVKGKLIQTKLTPTIYDSNFQTEIMANDKAEKFLERLGQSRPQQ